mmetsp:Transcript_16107/g.33331  ORF Transcript_16107/g.33331 Transcript_16107/m.33331 type:complete len:684 (-) Transcript_16107:98-2149(-)
MSSARKRSGTRSAKSSDKKLTAGEHPGLRQLVQRRILDDVFQNAGEKHPGWKVLIVDEPAMKVISAAVGMYDIMERKVTIVENLDKKRAPFPDMAAIYVLEPNADSVSKLIADFSGEKILYGDAVFVYFLGRLSDSLLDQIKNCRKLLKRIKGLVEINVDFLAKEERAFTLDMSDAFTSFYLRNGKKSVEAKVADRLVTVCATLNEYPHIRYKQTSALGTKIANIFHRKMDEFVAQNPNWWYHGGSTKGSGAGKAKRDRGVLLLVDRADDCLTPLMHDFTYQSMIHDLLKMDGDRITYQAETSDDSGETEAKDVLLDERDKLWVEIRGKHIAAVIETLSNRIREIMSSSTGSSLNRGGGNMSLSQMASALKALPEYKEVMSKLSQHMHLSHECMDVFRRENLLDLSELEQTLATGKDDEGRSPKMPDMIDQVDDFLIRIKSAKDRLRLILITTISQGGLRSQDRRRLMGSAELSRKDIRTLNSLELLGLNIFNSSSSAEAKNKLVSMLTGDRLAANDIDDEAEYAASRYVPALKPVLEQLCSNDLSIEDFPSVMPMPDMGPSSSVASSSRGGTSRSARNKGSGSVGSSARPSAAASSVRKKAGGASSKWSKSSNEDPRSAGSGTKFSGGRNIVFMLGGITYAEIRQVREVSQKMGREIIVGSTDFITASDFIDDLTVLGQDDE